jgi:hypothetical protein
MLKKPLPGATGQANDKLTAAVGIGLMVFIRAVDRSDPNPAYLVGPIPLFVGAALLAPPYFLAPKQP